MLKSLELAKVMGLAIWRQWRTFKKLFENKRVMSQVIECGGEKNYSPWTGIPMEEGEKLGQ